MKRTRQTLFEGVLIGCVVALAISILLPTLRARVRDRRPPLLPEQPEADRAGDAAVRERSRRKPPDSFATLLRTENLTPEVFIWGPHSD